jgi:hypothetical protein
MWGDQHVPSEYVEAEETVVAVKTDDEGQLKLAYGGETRRASR